MLNEDATDWSAECDAGECMAPAANDLMPSLPLRCSSSPAAADCKPDKHDEHTTAPSPSSVATWVADCVGGGVDMEPLQDEDELFTPQPERYRRQPETDVKVQKARMNDTIEADIHAILEVFRVSGLTDEQVDQALCALEQEGGQTLADNEMALTDGLQDWLVVDDPQGADGACKQAAAHAAVHLSSTPSSKPNDSCDDYEVITFSSQQKPPSIRPSSPQSSSSGSDSSGSGGLFSRTIDALVLLVSLVDILMVSVVLCMFAVKEVLRWLGGRLAKKTKC